MPECVSGMCVRHIREAPVCRWSCSRTCVFPVSFNSLCPSKRSKSKPAKAVCCITPSHGGGKCTDGSTLSLSGGIHHLWWSVSLHHTESPLVLCGCSWRMIMEGCFFFTYFLFKLNPQNFSRFNLNLHAFFSLSASFSVLSLHPIQLVCSTYFCSPLIVYLGWRRAVAR